jgi:hypothetical protein
MRHFPFQLQGQPRPDHLSRQCFTALRMSVESGFFSYPYIDKNPLLNHLHGEPEFARILNIAQQRHEAFKNSFFR